MDCRRDRRRMPCRYLPGRAVDHLCNGGLAVSDDSESDRAYNRRMFSDAARAWRKADCMEQAANERAQHLADIAAEADARKRGD